MAKKEFIFKRPKVEVAPLTEGVAGDFIEIALDEQHKDAVTLTPTLGSIENAVDGNGDIIESDVPNTSYSLTVKALQEVAALPLVNGVAEDEYAVKITKRGGTKGYLLGRCKVQGGVAIDASGENTTYTFTAMKPATGGVIEPIEATGA